MVDKTLPDLDAVVTPVATDILLTRQAADTEDRRYTRAQIYTLLSGEHLLLPSDNDAATPTLAFGDGDTGFYEVSDDFINMAFAGVFGYQFGSGSITSSNTGSFALLRQNASATLPSFAPDRSDNNTGIGHAGADQLSLIAGGVEGGRIEALQATFGNYVFDTDQVVGAGQDGFILTYDDASGQILLEAAAGGGNVSNTGTPLDNQVAVWTNATTIEGDANFTWDGALLTTLNLACDAFTSNGIDDNATGERFELQDTVAAWGDGSAAETWTHQMKTTDDGLLIIAGGNSGSQGGSVAFYGQSHATRPGDLLFRSNNNPWLFWDESAGDLEIRTGTGVKTSAMTIGPTQDMTLTAHLILPQVNDAVTPTLAFGDGDTGFYEAADDELRVATLGSTRFVWTGDVFGSDETAGPGLVNEVATATTPTFYPRRDDTDTGIGAAGLNQLSLIAGGVEAARAEATQFTMINFVFDSDQTVGAGQDNFVLTYDNASGDISLEAIPTHTGQVTGDTDLSLDITAITDQPASGALVAGDTILTNDGGVLSESTLTQLLAFMDANITFPEQFTEYHWGATDFNNPNNSDWEITNLAPAVVDSNDNALTVRAFDDTAQEAVGLQFKLPDNATEMTIQWVSRAETAPGSPAVAKPELFYHDIPDNAAVPANPWSSFSMNDTDIPTNEFFQYDSQTITFSTLSLTAGEYVQMQFCRDPGHANDDLSGDWIVFSVNISFA